MALLVHQTKGLTRCLVDEDISEEDLHIHISEIAPGTRAHPPHSHEGIEAFYVLEGEGTLEVGEERYLLHANEAAILDAGKVHGLANTGASPMKYMVIIARR